jgi:hypothetical protein
MRIGRIDWYSTDELRDLLQPAVFLVKKLEACPYKACRLAGAVI